KVGCRGCDESLVSRVRLALYVAQIFGAIRVEKFRGGDEPQRLRRRDRAVLDPAPLKHRYHLHPGLLIEHARRGESGRFLPIGQRLREGDRLGGGPSVKKALDERSVEAPAALPPGAECP